MAYTLGVLENALKQLKDRIDSYRATGKDLVDIKQVYIGSRPQEIGGNSLPIIIINPVGFQDETMTMAYSGGQKQGTFELEIRILAEKIMDDVNAKYSTNVLFDSAGKGVLAYFQWLIDALVFKTDSTYSPTIDLQLDAMPDVGFRWEETAKTVEIFANVSLKIRYTLGGFGGVST